MEDAIDPGKVEIFLGEIDARDIETGGILFLQRRVVVVREAVDREYLMPPASSFCQMRADEPGSPSDDVPSPS